MSNTIFGELIFSPKNFERSNEGPEHLCDFLHNYNYYYSSDKAPDI